MPLPNYRDGEVRYFHPVVEDALNVAIINLGLETEYEVEHEPRFGTIPPDFAIKSKISGKYHLIVEVKRTPNDVVSTRYRYQAKSYIDEAKSLAEKKYYAITNMEQTDLFLHSNDAGRSSVLLQMLDGGPYISGTLEKANSSLAEEIEFKNKLIENFEKILILVRTDFTGYAEISSRLYELLSMSCENEDEWHQALMTCGYEWMRGVMSSHHRLPRGLNDAITYRGNSSRLAEKGKLVDFATLFSEPYPRSADNSFWDSRLLAEMNRLGKTRTSGDELAIFAHEILFSDRYHDGVVMTDLELSKLLAAVSKRIHGEEISDLHKICDPAAGAGTLLANVQNSFHNIQPKQIWANEKERLLMEPLAIRVGLAYASVLSPDNAPMITINNILNLERSDFENVKVILMNPPYLRRVDCVDMCNDFARRIEELSGTNATTYAGQNGIESLFTELVYELAPEGATICCILPKQYLQLRGLGGQEFRNFLLNKFKVRLIVNYPMKGLFDKVTKATSIYATKKSNDNYTTVESMDISLPLSELDNMSEFENTGTSPYGVQVDNIEVEALQNSIQNGWFEHFNSNEEFNEVLENWRTESRVDFCKLGEVRTLMIRSTTLGRHGGVKLLFPFSNRRIKEAIEHLIPENWLSFGINNARSNIAFRNMSNTERFLSPPNIAFVDGTNENLNLVTIIEAYNNIMGIIASESTARQRVIQRTTNELLELLVTEKTMVSDHPVLIPRNIRRHGKIHYLDLSGYVSSNFIEIYGSETDKKVLASWLMTSFAQLNFETVHVNREGARKLEEPNLSEIYIPKIENLSVEEKNQLTLAFETLINNDSFIDLYCPAENGSIMDDLWYELLWGENKDNAKDDIIGYLSDAVHARTPNVSC